MKMRALSITARSAVMLVFLAGVASCSDDRYLLNNGAATPPPLTSAIPQPTPAPPARTDRLVTETCDESAEQPCLAIDADASTPGTQRSRDVAEGEQFAVDVVVHGVPEGGRGVGTFQFTLTYDRTLLEAAAPRPAEAIADLGGECGVFEPSGDVGDDNGFADGDPATGDALLACIFIALPESPPGPTGSVALGRVEFTAAGAGTSPLRLVLSQVDTKARLEPPLVDCSPGAPSPGGGCQDAAITVE